MAISKDNEQDINRYGVVIEGWKRKGGGEFAAESALRGRVERALAPFIAAGEAEILGTGAITCDIEEGDGIVFHATPEARDAVVRAFPDGNVIDNKGRRQRLQPPAGKAPKPDPTRGFPRGPIC